MPELTEYTKKIEDSIQNLSLHREPNELYEPVRYILSLGGKRIRPLLTLLSAGLFTDNIDAAVPAAMAIEIFHNFTLLHDDIMDNADIRRGKDTVHKVWNKNTAILSGDASMILAYEQLSKLPADVFSDVFMVFNQTALEVCEGQQFDMNFEDRKDVNIQEYTEMIRLKTSVLIAASMKIGAILGGASLEEQEALYEVGESIGLAFQIQDDYLDVFSNEEKFGKINGGDILNNKKTYLLITALNSTIQELVNKLNTILDTPNMQASEKIQEVKKIYHETGAERDTQLAAISFTNNAIEILNQLNIERMRKKPLEDIIFKLMYRES